MVGHEGAVDEDAVADDPVGRAGAGRRERVGQLVVAVEGAVGDHQRDVALAARQRQRGVELVVDDPHPGQPAPDVRGGAVEAVVVVPLEGGAFGAAVLDQVVDVGFALARARSAGRCRTARGERPARDLAVEGERLGLGQAAGLAVELGAVVAAVQVDRELADARPAARGGR